MTKKLTPSQIKKAKRLLKKLSSIKKSSIQLKTNPVYDENYFKALEYWEKN